MANNLKTEKKIAVISALAEGCSIRSIERMTSVHRDTIMRLGVRVGQGCERLLDDLMRNLDCQDIQADEIWGYVKKKERNRLDNDSRDWGDVWTFVAIDRDTKLVPCHRVGKRTVEDASAFMVDLSERLTNRVQVSTDGLRAYIEAIEQGFGGDVDYGQIVKTYSGTEAGRYSPGIIKRTVVGAPIIGKICTSHVERQNLTMRMHCRRLTRLTNAFSKKLENFKAAVALHFAFYNLVKTHTTLRTTPAMAAGVMSHSWSVADLVEFCG